MSNELHKGLEKATTSQAALLGEGEEWKDGYNHKEEDSLQQT